MSPWHQQDIGAASKSQQKRGLKESFKFYAVSLFRIPFVNTVYVYLQWTIVVHS